MSCMRYYPEGSSVSVCIKNLRGKCSQNPVVNATVTVNLLDPSEGLISGPYEDNGGDGAGNYEATVPGTVDLSAYENIYLEVLIYQNDEFMSRLLQPMRVGVRQVCG